METAPVLLFPKSTGLINLGNTCFLNACIQTLVHLPELRTAMMSNECMRLVNAVETRFDESLVEVEAAATDIQEGLESAIDNATVYLELLQLGDLLVSAAKQSRVENRPLAVSPKRFVHTVQGVAQTMGRELFTGWAQNDMPEFMMFVVECLHNAAKRPVNIVIHGQAMNDMDVMATQCYNMLRRVYDSEFSEVMQLLYGMLVSELRSVDDNPSVVHAVNPEQFFMIDLPVVSLDTNVPCTSLIECFRQFTRVELMNGANAWFHAESGKAISVNKRIMFWQFPPVLVITLKRFTPDGRHKHGHQIVFPVDGLDLSQFVVGYNPQRFVYDLVAVCNHVGGIQGGHYTTFARGPSPADPWVHYNDSTVTMVGAQSSHIITPMAYCLVYRQRRAI